MRRGDLPHAPSEDYRCAKGLIAVSLERVDRAQSCPYRRTPWLVADVGSCCATKSGGHAHVTVAHHRRKPLRSRLGASGPDLHAASAGTTARMPATKPRSGYLTATS